MSRDWFRRVTPGRWRVVAKANDYRTTDVVVGKTIVATNISGNDSSLIAAAPLLLADNKRLHEIITQVQHLLCDMSGDDWRVNDALDLIDDYEQSEWEEEE